MQTDKRPADDDGGRDDGRGDAAPGGAAGSRDAYEDERDQAIDADPQLREVGRARLRKRAGRPDRGDGAGAAPR